MASDLERAVVAAGEWERRRRAPLRSTPPTLDDLEPGSDLLIVTGRLNPKVARGVRRVGFVLIFDDTHQQRWYRPAGARPPT
jgi:hypothetical protein